MKPDKFSDLIGFTIMGICVLLMTCFILILSKSNSSQSSTELEPEVVYDWHCCLEAEVIDVDHMPGWDEERGTLAFRDKEIIHHPGHYMTTFEGRIRSGGKFKRGSYKFTRTLFHKMDIGETTYFYYAYDENIKDAIHAKPFLSEE